MQRAADLVKGITNVFIGIVVVILGLRFIFRMLNANQANDLVAWLYDISGPLMDPFRGIFPTQALEPGYIVEFSTLFAMVAYALFGFLVLAIVELLQPARRRTAEEE